jgi:cytochrome c peroxidase
VEHTGPYMHDGRFRTLDEVLQFYNNGLKQSAYAHPLMKNVAQGGMKLSPVQLQQLKAFLLTLTDEELLANPAFSNPRPDNPFFVKIN